MAVSKPKQVEAAAVKLLDALDRMHGRQSLSHNVCNARDELRRLVHKPDPRDATR